MITSRCQTDDRIRIENRGMREISNFEGRQLMFLICWQRFGKYKLLDDARWHIFKTVLFLYTL